MNRLRALIGGLLVFAGQLIIPAEEPLYPAFRPNDEI